MQAIANLDTQDTYAPELTLEDELATSLTISVIANNSAVAKFRPARREGGSEESYIGIDVLLTPQAQVVPNVSGVKFKSAEAGKPARIAALLLRPDDPQIGAGIPFTGTLSAGGGVTQGSGGVTQLAYNERATTQVVAATSQPTADQIIAAGSVAVDGTFPIVVEAYLPRAEVFGANITQFDLFEDGVIHSTFGQHKENSGLDFDILRLERQFTPTSGNHVYALRAWQSAAGGANMVASAAMVIWIRVSKVAT